MERLADRDAFRRLRSEGRRHRAAVLSMVVRTGEDCTAPSVAFAIPKKVGNAVTRNRLRRRVREILRTLDREQLLPAGDYLVLPTEAAGRCSSAELRQQVLDLVERVREDLR